MDDQHSISLSEKAVKDATKLFGAQMIVAFVSVALSAWLIRKVPPAELALWPVALGLGGVIAAFGSFGMGDFFVRTIPKLLARGEEEEAAAVLKSGVILNLLGCGAATLLLYLTAEGTARVFLHNVHTAPMVRVLAGAAFFLALRERLGWALKAVEEFGKVALLKVIVDVGRLPAMVVFFLLYGVKGMLFGLMLVPFAASVLSLWWLRRYMFASWRFAPPGRLMAVAWPYYGVSLAALAAGRAQYLLIGMLTTPVALASYFVANKFAGYLQYFGKFAITVVTPKLAHKGAVGLREAERAMNKCTRYIFLGLLPLHLGVAILARPLIRLYAGRQYADAAIILAILAVALFVQAMFALYRSGVQVLGKPWHLLALSILQGIVNLATLVLFVRPWGAVGAALALAVTYAVLSAAALLVLSTTARVAHDRQALLSGLWATIGMALAAGTVQVALDGANHKVILLVASMTALTAYILSLMHQLARSDVELVYRCLPRGIRENRAGQAIYEWLMHFFTGETIQVASQDAVTGS